MAQSVNADMVNQFIHDLAKSNGCSKRKERLELLNQIAEKGKELLGDLNATDKDVCEIIDDIDDLYEEMIKWQEDVTDAEGNVNNSQKSLSELYEELDVLTAKEANGTLTDAEKARLEELREQVAVAESKVASDQGTLESLGDGSSITDLISNDFAMLDGLTEAMEGYAEAGEAIKDSANKYGKANMNCEKAMERNERSWWSNALGWAAGGAAAGAAGIAGAGAIKAAGTYAATEGTTKLGAIISGAGTAMGPVGWVALGVAAAAGVGGAIANKHAYDKMNTYLDRMGYQEVGNNSQTFYDAMSHEYIAEYDVIEGKGGNQIGGKMRKATAKVYSYGKTITTAAHEIEKKPDAVKAKKPEEKPAE